MNNKHIIILLLGFIICSCSTEATWTDKDIEITITPKVVSAGYVECDFSTNHESYYLIAIQHVDKDNPTDVDPFTQPKQFMMLALDSANLKYMEWRNYLLKKGEFNIAPFASHSLQYGSIKHFFTGLIFDEKYWIYAFAVNPETLQPISKLYIKEIQTTEEGIVDVHFEYRIKGVWDYIYPVDSNGNILQYFPYIATTRDSAELTKEEDFESIEDMILEWTYNQFRYPANAEVYYGVHATENTDFSEQSYLGFESGHTYYTAICGFDGIFEKMTLYKFKWYGEDTEYYFVDTDSTNVLNLYK